MDSASASATALAQRVAAKAEKKRLKALKPEGSRTESLRLFQADSIPAGLRYRVCERCKENKDAAAKSLKSPRESSALSLPSSPKQIKVAGSEAQRLPVVESKGESIEEEQTNSSALEGDVDNIEMKKDEIESGKAPVQSLQAITPTSTPHGTAGVKIEESLTQNPSATGLHCARCPSSYHLACALESGSGSSPSSSESREGWTCFKCR